MAKKWELLDAVKYLVNGRNQFIVVREGKKIYTSPRYSSAAVANRFAVDYLVASGYARYIENGPTLEVQNVTAGPQTLLGVKYHG